MKRFEKADVALIAISVDTVEKSRPLVKKLGLTFPVLSDPALVATRAYGVDVREAGIAWPAIFIVGRDRTIGFRSLKPNYKERPATEVILGALLEVR